MTGDEAQRTVLPRNTSEILEETAQDKNDLRFQTICEHSPLGIFVDDARGYCLYVNPTYEQITGMTLEAARGLGWMKHIHPDDHVVTNTAWKLALQREEQGLPFDYIVVRRCIRPDGIVRWVCVRSAPMRDAQGRHYGYVGTMEDITERRHNEELIQQNQARLSALIEHFPTGILLVDEQGIILLANQVFCRLFELEISPEELTGQPQTVVLQRIAQKVLPADDFLKSIHLPFVDRQGILPGELTLVNGRILERNHVPIQVQGRHNCHLSMYRDVTEQKHQELERKQLLQEAQERANRDTLTGLLNHGAFHNRLYAAVEVATEAETSFVVALIDADHFKFVNDAYGHTVGDRVLRSIGETLRSVCRATDSVARIGGDEFALLMVGGSRLEAEDLIHRIKTVFAQQTIKLEGEGFDIPVSLSVGTACYPLDGTNSHEILRVADERLYRDKREGRRSGLRNMGIAETLRLRVTGAIPGFPMLDTLISTVDSKDRYTRRHSEDVMLYSMMLGERMGLNDQDLAALLLAALIHDVGKIGLPDALLRSKEPLSREERQFIEQHPVLSAAIVGAVSGLEHTVPAVRHHHEQWDGNGYPDKLAGENIPLAARILSVADAFSALTTERPYRRRLSEQAALELLRVGSGKHWDERCVAAFIRALEERSSHLGSMK